MDGTSVPSRLPRATKSGLCHRLGLLLVSDIEKGLPPKVNESWDVHGVSGEQAQRGRSGSLRSVAGILLAAASGVVRQETRITLSMPRMRHRPSEEVVIESREEITGILGSLRHVGVTGINEDLGDARINTDLRPRSQGPQVIIGKHGSRHPQA